jgi:hypothetical protein
MSSQRPLPPRPLPSWLVLGVSLFIAFHLFAVGMHVLAAPSGPWLSPFGPSTAIGPIFAGRIDEVTRPYYLRPLHMTHNYHFIGNRPDAPGIEIEVRLKDADGRLIKTVRFPTDQDNLWLRQRHTIMAAQLGDDEPVQAPGAVPIPAPGKAAETKKIWDPSPAGPNQMTLRAVPVHLIPKNQPVFRPRDWSQITARAYARHLCRENGAASAELVRRSRQPVQPSVLFMPEPPANTFDTLVSTFEEYPHEK